NVFVIAAILLERNLQNVANYLIVSLAVADLMVACLVMPLGAVYEVSLAPSGKNFTHTLEQQEFSGSPMNRFLNLAKHANAGSPFRPPLPVIRILLWITPENCGTQGK
ncbi:unnamed protein product, partial [Nesidiocoris tenuis]